MPASGTPVHLPITLQPSTQSWRVICVREGIACSSARLYCAGRATSPPTFSRQSAKRSASSCRYRRLSGIAGAVAAELVGDVVFA
jgi:hypothetical protein